ncbi:GtrA family protein [Parablautia intestinalis]|jgi:putative flippase GtrA|uniref:GtrA family protein n=2 Tax=Parablautia intestinalis TaxID=2320100 RepID=A0A3A9AG47_9FIRM|nr:GtrA family protein [Parablautia intestinalis]MCI8614574.1 GtrA family protein [Lachnospiraceae bacterium]RKI90258.1 GtrA family protein [Parablautia intestinalis]
MDNFLEKVIRIVFRILHIEVKERTVGSLVQFIKFGIVGLSNSAVGYALNIATLLLLKPYKVSWDYYAGNMVGFTLSVLWSFYWNNRFVFKLREGEKRNLALALFKAYLSYAFTGVVLSNILSYFWIDVLEISKMTAPLLNIVIGVPINFTMNKMWTFKDKGLYR